MTSFTTTPPPLPPAAHFPRPHPPRRPDEGSWPPGPYRSADRRTAVASFAHGLAAVASLAGVFVTLQVFPLLDKLDRFQLTLEEEEQWFESYETVTSIEATLSLVAIISLMAWLSRSVDNTPALGGGIARRGPRWAIGAWFIPLVNIVMPALILRDLARRVSVDGTGRAWLILSWWLIYWAPVLLDIYLLFVPIGGTDSIRELYAFIAAIGVINAAGYVMTIVVMRRLQHDAEHWAGRMQEGWR